MDSDDRFWLGINALAVILILWLTALGVSYWKDYNKKVSDMIAGGVDPLEVNCALQDTYGRNPVCLTLAASRK